MLAHSGGRVGNADGMKRVSLYGRKFIGPEAHEGPFSQNNSPKGWGSKQKA
jgi:hypothetical protein